MYQLKPGLAHAWSAPPRAKTGRLIANLGQLAKGTFFGEVIGVDHTYTFTTATVIPSTQVSDIMTETVDVIYTNVWSSRNNSGRFRGVKFGGIEYPGDREIAEPAHASTTKETKIPDLGTR